MDFIFELLLEVIASIFGVAMGNAAEKVQAAAKYVTTSVDEDGIMNALKHFKLL